MKHCGILAEGARDERGSPRLGGAPAGRSAELAVRAETRRIEERLRDPSLRQQWLRQDSLIFGGLIAGSVAMLQPFLTAPALDAAALVAVVSLSVALPLLVALLMINHHEAFRRRPMGGAIVPATKIVGQGLAILGLSAALWHITWIAGVALAVSAVIGSVVHAVAITRLEALD